MHISCSNMSISFGLIAFESKKKPNLLLSRKKITKKGKVNSYAFQILEGFKSNSFNQNCRSYNFTKLCFWNIFKSYGKTWSKTQSKIIQFQTLKWIFKSLKMHNVQSPVNKNPARIRENSQYEKCSPNIPLQLLCLHKLKLCAKIERNIKLQMSKNMSLTKILVSEINHKF